MAESFGKKEQLKKRQLKQREKEMKRAFKKENNNKGKSLDDMIIYVDVNGHFTDVPTHLQDRTAVAEPRKRGMSADVRYTGVVNNVTDKGYGFIKEDETKAQIFYHVSELLDEVNSGNRVSYQKETRDGRVRAIKIHRE
jgi:CspA family cold shock protein